MLTRYYLPAEAAFLEWLLKRSEGKVIDLDTPEAVERVLRDYAGHLAERSKRIAKAMLANPPGQ